MNDQMIADRVTAAGLTGEDHAAVVAALSQAAESERRIARNVYTSRAISVLGENGNTTQRYGLNIVALAFGFNGHTDRVVGYAWPNVWSERVTSSSADLISSYVECEIGISRDALDHVQLVPTADEITEIQFRYGNAWHASTADVLVYEDPDDDDEDPDDDDEDPDDDDEDPDDDGNDDD